MVVDLAQFEGFEWDDGNSDKNLVKHAVSNAECEEVFFNLPILLLDDEKHSEHESRQLLYGVTNSGRLLLVVFTARSNLIRVISARDMNRREREAFRKYEEDSQV